MKRQELEKELRTQGWTMVRHGRRHDIWSNGSIELVIPRHNEINEYTAHAILKKAKGGT